MKNLKRQSFVMPETKKESRAKTAHYPGKASPSCVMAESLGSGGVA